MIAARCKKCGNIGCSNDNLLCNNNSSIHGNYSFKLDKKEEENLEKYLNRLKNKYGSYGNLAYIFIPTGIGTVVKVRSSHNNKEKDISNLSNW